MQFGGINNEFSLGHCESELLVELSMEMQIQCMGGQAGDLVGGGKGSQESSRSNQTPGPGLALHKHSPWITVLH